MASSRLRLLLLKNKTEPSDTYYDIFAASGHTSEFIPLLEYTAVDVIETVKYLQSDDFLYDIDRFIITSQRAVKVFHECLSIVSQTNPFDVSRIRSKVGYTVGPATAQALKENGFVDVRGGSRAGNGLKLADIIIEELCELKLSGQSHSPNSQSIVFFTGVIRKDIIPAKLKANGISVKEVVIYKTEPKDGIIDNFLKCCSNPVDWIVFFSPQGTGDIVDQIVKTLPDAYIACIGPTTEEYLLLKGLKPHVVSAKPTAASLYEGIKEWVA